MKHFLLTLSAILAFVCEQSAAQTVSGFVFVDKNQNGVFDASDRGLSDIPVSNSKDLVLTNKKGLYVLTAIPGSSVFPILPSDYLFSGSKGTIQNTRFSFQQPLDSVPPKRTVDFALTTVPENTTFRMAAIGDVQVDNEQEINYTDQTLFPDLMSRKDLAFCLFLGDLVNDKPELLPTVKDMLSQLPSPSWTVFGNHDRKTRSAQPAGQPYNELLGSTSYAFNYGGVHFLILNNIPDQGKAGYEGAFSDDQLTFAANDLALVPKNSRIVVAMHVPLSYTGNKDRLLSLLKGRHRVLILSAHLHTVERLFLNGPDGIVPELVAGATCGSWWTGERDASGNPSGLMQCGSPRNYFVLDFSKDTYRLHFKGIGLDPSTQMDIWVSGQDTLDTHVEAFTGIRPNTVIATIFAGSDSTAVFMQVDGQRPVRMEQAQIVSPSVSRVSALSREKVYPTLYSHRAALRKRPSPHCWKAILPAGMTPGIHTIKITATDHFGFETSQDRLVLMK